MPTRDGLGRRKSIVVTLFIATLLGSTRAYDNGMGRRPPMGWNSWCTPGAGGSPPSLCNLAGADPCSSQQVREIVDAIKAEGLDQLGYRYVALDDCWSAASRSTSGELQPDTRKFPEGMAALAEYVHNHSLLLGLYTCVGTETCKGARPGSYGHYEQDARTLAGWGVDMVKMDHCSKPANESDQALYGAMSRALNATGRPILFSLCQWGESEVWEWGGDIAQMFRIQQDHLPFWSVPASISGGDGVGYGAGTKEIIEWMATLKPSTISGAYSHPDPDFLMTLAAAGRAQTMDFTASRTEFTFWCMWSSPLLIDTDLRNLTAEKRSIIANAEAIAIDQDGGFGAADRLSNASSGAQVWARPLQGGDLAVVLYNSHSLNSVEISVSWQELHLPAGLAMSVRDVWAGRADPVARGRLSATVAPRDVKWVRLKPAKV